MKSKVFLFVVILGIGFWLSVMGIGYFTVILPPKKDMNLNYYLPVVIENAHGIQVGTRVHVLGIDQGLVRYLDYFPIDENQNILFVSECEDLCQKQMKGQITIAVLNLRKSLEFYENYAIYSRYDSVIGEKVIEINPGSKIIKKQNQTLQVKKIEPRYLFPKEFFDLLVQNYQGLQINSKTLLRTINYDDPVTIIAEVIYENRESLRRIFSNLQEITHKINEGQGTIALLINDDSLVSEADMVLIEAIKFLQTYREGYESLRENKIFSNTVTGPLNFFGP
ncbi:MAG: hypothetical protein NZ853_11385 [Leptospiraceae bacterium]|nr:hypothetical protein [Leptospiraceae bacterium]MDW7977144.1 hypothetical protein [Leptospiraceae bacterium]